MAQERIRLSSIRGSGEFHQVSLLLRRRRMEPAPRRRSPFSFFASVVVVVVTVVVVVVDVGRGQGHIKQSGRNSDDLISNIAHASHNSDSLAAIA